MPLSAAEVRLLYIQAGTPVQGNPYMFPIRRVEGRPLEGLRKPWERAKRAAGLAVDLRIQDLRHILVSALANAGTRLFDIGAMLEHRSYVVTRCYAHHSPQRSVETAIATADARACTRPRTAFLPR